MNIKETLKSYGITSIYHFTDEENLPTIEKYGLQSLKNIVEKTIPVKHFGAEEISHSLDERRGLDKYVHLSFVKDHPMYHVSKARGNMKNPIWIEFDSSILYDDTTLFCDKVANKNGSEIFGIEKVLEKIDFETLTLEGFLDSGVWQKRKESRKAEILVLNSIGIDKIKGITYGN